MIFDSQILDIFFGNAVRRINTKTSYKKVYLTFDDGPNTYCTPDVLKILDKFDAKATFFCIANRALDNQELIKQILEKGHTIGDHSVDHGYNIFFKGRVAFEKWLQKSQDIFANELKIETIGFRPPAGARNLIVKKVLKEQLTPLILWDVRFFDACLTLTDEKISDKVNKVTDGSIILLHDTHKGENKEQFLRALSFMIKTLKEKEFVFLPIKKEDVG